MIVTFIRAEGDVQEVNAPDGRVSCRVLRHFVSGDLEFVRVLDEKSMSYITMVVNESGLLMDLPRNQMATDIYHANVRRAFPDSADPTAEAKKMFRQQIQDTFGADVEVIEGDNTGADAFIAGNAVLIPVPIEDLDRHLGA
jgi:hypothetical protein